MSFASNHLAWQQRVNIEAKQYSRSLERATLAGQPEPDLYNTYNALFQNQLRKISDIKLGSAQKRAIQTNKATYCYGGKTAALESPDTKPLEVVLPENQYKGKTEMMQQEVYQRSYRPATGQPLSRSRLTKGARVYYPNEYFKKVAYEKSECSQVQRDALGQRVRERFNEQVDYPETMSQKSHKLKSINLAETDRKSQQAPSQTSSFLRKRALTVKSSNKSRITVKSRRPNDVIVEEPLVEQPVDDAILVVDDNQEVVDGVYVNEDQIPAYDDETKPDTASVGTIRSTKSYVVNLEKLLRDEIEKRSQLEQEIYEMKKINELMAKNMGL